MVKNEFLFSEERLPGLKRATISASGLGDNTIVAAVSGKKLRVYQFCIVAAGAVTAKFQSGAAGTDITGPLALAANGILSSGWNPTGHFDTAESVLLNLNLGGAVAVGGWITYSEI
jgi:hypothetical protein